LGRAEIGGGGGHDLPGRLALVATDDAGGSPKEREQVTTVGFVSHRPLFVDVRMEHTGVVRRGHGGRRVE
jgi:hypothetical protein